MKETDDTEKRLAYLKSQNRELREKLDDEREEYNNLVNKHAAELEKTKDECQKKVNEANATLVNMSNWLRFTLGIAVATMPESEELQAMVKALYKA